MSSLIDWTTGGNVISSVPVRDHRRCRPPSETFQNGCVDCDGSVQDIWLSAVLIISLAGSTDSGQDRHAVHETRLGSTRNGASAGRRHSDFYCKFFREIIDKIDIQLVWNDQAMMRNFERAIFDPLAPLSGVSDFFCDRVWLCICMFYRIHVNGILFAPA